MGICWLSGSAVWKISCEQLMRCPICYHCVVEAGVDLMQSSKILSERHLIRIDAFTNLPPDLIGGCEGEATWKAHMSLVSNAVRDLGGERSAESSETGSIFLKEDQELLEGRSFNLLSP